MHSLPLHRRTMEAHPDEYVIFPVNACSFPFTQVTASVANFLPNNRSPSRRGHGLICFTCITSHSNNRKHSNITAICFTAHSSTSPAQPLTQCDYTYQDDRKREEKINNRGLEQNGSRECEKPGQQEVRREKQGRSMRENRVRAGTFERKRHPETVQSFRNRLASTKRQEQQTEHWERMAQYREQMDEEIVDQQKSRNEQPIKKFRARMNYESMQY